MDALGLFRHLLKKAARSRSCLLILLEGVLGLSVKDLRQLTVRETQEQLRRVRGVPHVKTATDLLDRYVAHHKLHSSDYLFFSRKKDSLQMRQAIGRQQVWRILKTAVEAAFSNATGAINAIRTLWAQVLASQNPEVSTDLSTSPRPRVIGAVTLLVRPDPGS